MGERTENQPDDMNTDNDQEGRDKEILLKNLEAVRQQVAELQARLESIRREQLRLQRQFQYDQWQKDEKMIMEQHLAEIKSEIHHLKIEDTAEAKFEIECKLAQLKIRVNDFIYKLENSFSGVVT